MSFDVVPTEIAAPCPRVEIVGIQYLRGLAAMLVVAFHISLHVNELSGLATLSTLQSGVDIFFVISGFVMMFSTDLGRRATATEFMLKRIVRVVPLYWAATIGAIVMLLVVPQFVRSIKVTWLYAAASLGFVAQESPASPGLYVPLVSPGWTLELEILFYLCFTIGLAIGQSGWRLFFLAAAPVVGLALVGLATRPANIASFYTNPIMLEFIYGMLLAALFLRGRLVLLPQIAALLVVVAFALLTLMPVGDLFDRWLYFGVPALAMVAGALWVSWPFWRLPHLIGDASYSIYISHFFLLSALAQLWSRLGLTTPAKALWLYPVGIVVCASAGILCWKLLEAPLTKLARVALLPPRTTSS